MHLANTFIQSDFGYICLKMKTWSNNIWRKKNFTKTLPGLSQNNFVLLSFLLVFNNILISVVKWLIASKIKVFVYIIYVCVLCIFIMYI